MSEGGRVLNFVMNDRCAAGTGRFLEVMAQALEVRVEDLGPLSLRSTSRVSISSTCTVFAESEVVGLIARGCLGRTLQLGYMRPWLAGCAAWL